MPQYRVGLIGYAIILAPDEHEATVVAQGISTGLNLANGELNDASYTDWLDACGIKCIQVGLERDSLQEDHDLHPDRHGYIDPGPPYTEE